MEALFIPLNISNMNKKIERVSKDNFEYFKLKEDHGPTLQIKQTFNKQLPR